MLKRGFTVHAGNHPEFIGNIVGACWAANRGFGSINKSCLTGRTDLSCSFIALTKLYTAHSCCIKVVVLRQSGRGGGGINLVQLLVADACRVTGVDRHPSQTRYPPHLSDPSPAGTRLRTSQTLNSKLSIQYYT